eukprot:TRINITY_DN11239_c0_g1_i2.p1 TRINITY_DN11239_c0_g1~~TRINITY_DN11239_c0_g1_i2.p1  ORF type:complete len:449 (-),score=81.41 TRINITY_DN11239_c0_g1_i2:311-1582(-)
MVYGLLKLLLACFLLASVGAPLLVLTFFRSAEISAIVNLHPGFAGMGLLSVVVGTWKGGWRGCFACIAVVAAVLTYAMDMSLWKPEPNSMTGRVAVVTGANSGLGFAVSKLLAGLGAHVIVTCRSVAKCSEVVAAATEAGKASGGSAEAVVFDLGSLASASRLAADLNKRHPAIHLLVNNAGGTPVSKLTEDGLEDGFGGMHLAHMALSLGLLPSLQAGGTADRPARVVMVSSEAGVAAATAAFGQPFDDTFMVGDGEGDLRGEKIRGDGTTFGSLTAYGRAKLSNALFAFELTRRCRAKGLPIISHALHTGGVYTTASANGIGTMFTYLPGLPYFASQILMPALWRTPEQGASTLLYAALATEPPSMLRGGEWIDALCHAVLSDNSANMIAMRQADSKWGERLWSVSLRLIKNSPASSVSDV